MRKRSKQIYHLRILQFLLRGVKTSITWSLTKTNRLQEKRPLSSYGDNHENCANYDNGTEHARGSPAVHGTCCTHVLNAMKEYCCRLSSLVPR